jgi:hypothetical protein
MRSRSLVDITATLMPRLEAKTRTSGSKNNNSRSRPLKPSCSAGNIIDSAAEPDTCLEQLLTNDEQKDEELHEVSLNESQGSLRSKSYAMALSSNSIVRVVTPPRTPPRLNTSGT